MKEKNFVKKERSILKMQTIPLQQLFMVSQFTIWRTGNGERSTTQWN